MIKLGLVGLGYWGPNLARVLCQTQRAQLVAVCDIDSNKVDNIISRYSHLKGFQTAEAMLESDVDAVVIATPISTHYALALEALNLGKHVLVEKPLTHSSQTAHDLVMRAQKAGRVLMTGHTFIYSPPVVKIKSLIDSGMVGDLHYISSSRVNLGLYRKDVDVIWDLAVHDVSILLYWLNDVPVRASSFGRSCIQQERNDVAFLWLEFAGGVVASCEVSWLSPRKMRRTCVVGSNRMIVYDDTEPNEKVKIFDRGVEVKPPQTFGEFQLTYRLGDVVSPHLDNTEPLLSEVEHFVRCIETGGSPHTDGKFGADVVRVIEMATRSSWLMAPRPEIPAYEDWLQKEG